MPESKHPALSPSLGRSNVATLAAEYRRLELHEATDAGADAYARAGELLMTMWRSSVIATRAMSIEIDSMPMIEDDRGAIRRRLEQLWIAARTEADETISAAPGTEDSAAAIVRLEVIAGLIETLEDEDLVPSLGELLEDGAQ